MKKIYVYIITGLALWLVMFGQAAAQSKTVAGIITAINPSFNGYQISFLANSGARFTTQTGGTVLTRKFGAPMLAKK